MKSLFLAATLTVAAQGSYAQTNSQDSLALDSIWKQMEINEVAVTAQKRLVKNEIDKTTYDVQADKESKTSTALEMLRKVPMVTVDGQDAISVKGSSAFKIYRNGHPDPALQGSNASDILKTMPASTIKRIEVITDPGAKEDAEGTTFILNIVMNTKQRSQGVMGMAISSYEALNDSYREGLMLTTQKGKLAASVNYGYMHLTQEQANQTETHYKESGQTLTTHDYSLPPVNVHNIDLNASLDIDSLNLMTLNFGGFYYKVDTTADGETTMTAADGTPLYSYATDVTTPKYNYYNLHGRYDYQHKTRLDGEVLTASYMLSTTRTHIGMDRRLHDGYNMPIDYTGYGSRNKENFMEHTFQLDYVRPFARWHKLEVGAKYIYRDNHSQTAMNYTDASYTPDSNTDFKHQTQVGAAYMQWMYNRSYWAMRAGLRYEYSRLEASYPDGSAAGYHKNLNDWVPSASVQYKLSDVDAIRLSYHTTITRPGIEYLNPAVVSSPTREKYGNAALNSARSNRLGLSMSHVGNVVSYNTELYYRFSNNQIAALQGVRDGIIYFTYGDKLHQKSWGLYTSMQLRPTKTTMLSLNMDATRQIYNDYGMGLSLDGWNGTLSANLTQRLPWKLLLNAAAQTTLGRTVNSVYEKSGSNYFCAATLQRSFLKDDRLTVRFEVANPFGPHYMTYRTYTQQGDYTGIGHHMRYQKKMGITLSYRFGKLSSRVKNVNKTIENDDVVGGLKQSAQ